MWLNEARLVLRDRVVSGALRVEDGRIAEVVEGGTGGPGGVSAGGMLVLPGLVDVHGDMLERELRPRPSVEIDPVLALHEVDKRLVSAGVLTGYAAISFAWIDGDHVRSTENAKRLIATVAEQHEHLLADHRVHVRLDITNPDAAAVVADELERDRVGLVSIMDHTPGQGQYRDIEAYVQTILEWRRDIGHKDTREEDVWDHVRRAQERPKGWDAIDRVAELAKAHGVPLASHDDDSVEKVAMLDELGVTISEFPVSEEAAAEARRRQLHTVMGAPNALRGTSHSGNLSAAEAVADGLVDVLASDYYPIAMLQAAFRLVARGICELPDAVALVTANPAEAAELDDRGRIAEGLRADLVLVEPEPIPRVRCSLRQGVPVYWDRRMSELNELASHFAGVSSAPPASAKEPI